LFISDFSPIYKCPELVGYDGRSHSLQVLLAGSNPVWMLTYNGLFFCPKGLSFLPGRAIFFARKGYLFADVGIIFCEWWAFQAGL
jgi:hypothetical protein